MLETEKGNGPLVLPNSFWEMAAKKIGKIRTGVPVEKINATTTARTIINSVGVESCSSYIERWKTSPFTATTILNGFDYYIAWFFGRFIRGQDYWERFPQAHQAVRRSLLTLVNEGVLSWEQYSADINFDNELIWYRVISEKKLLQFAGSVWRDVLR